jgi:hypothetical protein
MNRVTQVVLLVLVIASSLGAQTLSTESGAAIQPLGAQTTPIGKKSTTRWLLDFETGSNAGLGFKEPHLAFGFSFERPVGRKVELQGGASFSPDRKYITNDGTSMKIESASLYWITQAFAVTGGIRRSTLWTSQFKKSEWGPSAGIAVREYAFGYPGRVYVDYLFSTGCQWGTNCPIQSNRTQGPEIYWEKRASSHFRVGFEFGFYHILNQSDQLRPDIPRTGQWTGDVHILMRFEFPRGTLDNPY